MDNKDTLVSLLLPLLLILACSLTHNVCMVSKIQNITTIFCTNSTKTPVEYRKCLEYDIVSLLEKAKYVK